MHNNIKLKTKNVVIVGVAVFFIVLVGFVSAFYVNGIADLVRQNNTSDVNVVLTQVQKLQSQSAFSIFLLILLSVIILFILLVVFNRSLDVRINDIKKNIDYFQKGNLNVSSIDSSNDEIGFLLSDFNDFVSFYKKIIAQLRFISSEKDKADSLININEFDGVFKLLASEINNVIGRPSRGVDVTDIIRKFSAGCFDSSFSGIKDSEVVSEMENLHHCLNAVYDEILRVSSAITEGRVSERAYTGAFSGSWLDMMIAVNSMLDAAVNPISETSSVLGDVSKGNLNAYVKGNYKGDYLCVKDNLNKTVTMLSVYINEISSVLTEISQKNLNVAITRDYIGDFSSIKESIGLILNSFNLFMSEINASANQVATGSGMVSDTSRALSDGASDQMSALEQLSATIENIDNQIQLTAKNAANANNLAVLAKKSAEDGNAEMEEMLNAMEEINAASNNIYKIIKVIDDIASQTNLLALNASVEAARAGEMGRGFAVVAEEVRSLATKSQTAAKETAALIEGSINSVNKGSRIVNVTATALAKIVEDISSVSDIIAHITESSEEQTYGIAQINQATRQISEVTETNSYSSQECASAAAELSAQSDLMKQMVTRFKLKYSNSF